MPKKAALLDVDCSVLDTENHVLGSTNEALSFYGLPNVTKEEYIRKMQPNYVKTMIVLGLTDKEMIKTYEDIYDGNMRSNKYNIGLYPNAKTFMERLNEICPTTLFTGSYRRQIDIYKRDFGLIGDRIVSKDDARRPKPKKAHFEEALRAAGSSPENTVLIDDMAHNLATAKWMGIHGIGLEWGFSDREKVKGLGFPSAMDFDEVLYEVWKFVNR